MALDIAGPFAKRQQPLKPKPTPKPKPPTQPPPTQPPPTLPQHEACTNDGLRRRLVWIKTHKTGSSTITNVFHRFAWEHKLNIAVPKDEVGAVAAIKASNRVTWYLL